MKKLSKGFTLVELLLVIAIIGVLSTMVIVQIGGAQEKARDSQRKSDLNQYRIALENYNNANGGYPPTNDAGIKTAEFCASLASTVGTPFLSGSCPADPKDGTVYFYQYKSNAAGLHYVLYAKLEQPNINGYFYYCSNGTNAIKATVPVVEDCD